MEHVVIFICINTFADSVMVYLGHDSYNIIFKIKCKLYVTSGVSPQRKVLGAHLWRKHQYAFFQQNGAVTHAAQ
jgi:hypothetical protein